MEKLYTCVATFQTPQLKRDDTCVREIVKCQQKQKAESKVKTKNKSMKRDDVKFNIEEKYVKILELSLKGLKVNETHPISQLIETAKVIEDSLEVFISHSNPVKFDEQLTIAIIRLNIGLLYTNSNEVNELLIGGQHLSKALCFLSKYDMNRKVILIILLTLKTLDIMWMKLGSPNKCYECLDKALELYIDYTNEKNHLEPIDIVSQFCDEETSTDSSQRNYLNELHLLTVEGLLRIYCYKIHGMHRFVMYLHDVLKKQLVNQKEFSSSDYVNWISVSLFISNYFTFSNRFSEGRHHIAVAVYMLEQYKKTKDVVQEECNYLHFQCNYGWTIYGFNLLIKSEHKIHQKRINLDYDDIDVPNVKLRYFTFGGIKKHLERITASVKDTYVSNCYQANIFITKLIERLDEIKAYYKKHDDILNQALITIDIFKAYRHLIFFESDKNKIMDIMITQTKLLEKMIKDLKKDLSLHNLIKDVYKVLCLHLGVINAARVDIICETVKMGKKDSIIVPEQNVIHKIFQNSIKHYKNYFLDI